MLMVDRLLQWLTLLLVACSGWLLGLGQQNSAISGLAVSAALLSYMLNDCWGVVRLSRWVANVVALLVTGLALRGFFRSDTDSADQLLMIANLLIYLQIVLLFQAKTPRVYWQILVLSLLQIVVAAAFNIRVEGGLIFFAYLLVSGIAMVVLQIHSQTYLTRLANAKTAASIRIAQSSPHDPWSAGIWTMHDQVHPLRRPIRGMARQVLALGIVGIGFAAVAFYLIPRDESAWSGSQAAVDLMPGSSRTVELEENVQIYLSGETMFEATFTDPGSSRAVELDEAPYFRGMPLPEAFSKNGQTRWRMATSSVMPAGPTILPWLWTRNHLIQSISLQPSPDPILHTVLPAARLSSTPAKLEWTGRWSLLRRSLDPDVDPSRTFRYDLAVPLDRDQRPLQAFPHAHRRAETALRLENYPDEWSRHTAIDRLLYPGLVRLADEIAAGLPDPTHPIALARAFENHLAEKGGFSYTLDFSDFNWTPGLDHLEDFVVNQRRGHCEFFASALVMMLRSQNVAARLVVGYHGGDFDKETGTYTVRKRNAHAWVEAYIPLESCPPEWLSTGQASMAGAWLRLDPTPASAEVVPPTTPLAAVRDFWNSYVMGLNAAKQQSSTFQSFVRNPFRNLAPLFTFEYWRMQWTVFTTKGQWMQSSVFKVIVLAAVVALLSGLHQWLRSRRRKRFPDMDNRRSPIIKQFLGRALALIAPRLGRWVVGAEPSVREVPFFQRFQRILLKSGLSRQPSETAREFGDAAVKRFAQIGDSPTMVRAIAVVIDTFYRVRFAHREITPDELRQVELSLDHLEESLKTAVPTS